MRTGLRVIALLVLLAGMAREARADRFTPLGFLSPGSGRESFANGISGDGTTVVGVSRSPLASAPDYHEAFRWTLGSGMVGLGDLPGGDFNSTAHGVSYDGSVIVGSGVDGSGANRPYRWTSGAGMVDLGPLPFGLAAGTAYGVSAGGGVIVGTAEGGTSLSFAWTLGTGAVYLGDLPGGLPYGRPLAISLDASTIVGRSSSLSSLVGEAFRRESGGPLVPLGSLPGGSAFSEARATSLDGEVVVGGASSTASPLIEAFRWTEAGGFEPLGLLPSVLPPGSNYSFANAVSANGNVIVGTSGNRAFLWTESTGMIGLKGLMQFQYGVDLTGWTLNEATGISANGRTIVGNGINPLGRPEAWIIQIPEPSTWLLALVGIAIVASFSRHQKRYNKI